MLKTGARLDDRYPLETEAATIRFLSECMHSLGTRVTNVEQLFQEILSMMHEVVHARGAATWGVEFVETPDPARAALESRRSLTEAARHALAKVEENFGDLEGRLHHFLRLKEHLKALCGAYPGPADKYARQVCEMLYDAVRFAYAEDLERTQIDVIEAVLDMLDREGMDLPDARTANQVLLAAGLESIPSGEANDEPSPPGN